jgi:formylglycine-generating enzyme required for sulfatase activity
LVDVFISYPRAERGKVEPIRERLAALGLKVFFDIEGIDGGDTFPDVIDRALKSAKAVLGVWSPRAFQSKWCMIECRVGATRGVLVPVAMERFSELDMKSDFMTTNYFDLTDFCGDEHHEGWQRTLRSLSRYTGRALVGTTPVTLQRQTSEPSCALLRAPEMVRIPPGRFLMGSPETEERWMSYDGREEPQHEVLINYAFELGKYEVTVDEFSAFVADAKHDTGNSAQIWDGKTYNTLPGKGWRDPGFSQTGKHPVCCVNWNDAQAYVAWLNIKHGLSGGSDGYRLPSEAEWEYACRAGTTTPFSVGPNLATTQANYIGDYMCGASKNGEVRGKTTPVGSFPPNPFGLHDMHGNIWEWCEDAWNPNYDGAPADGSAWLWGYLELRVLRGGSWDDGSQVLRSAARSWYPSTSRISYIGFRLARTV